MTYEKSPKSARALTSIGVAQSWPVVSLSLAEAVPVRTRGECLSMLLGS